MSDSSYYTEPPVLTIYDRLTTPGLRAADRLRRRLPAGATCLAPVQPRAERRALGHRHLLQRVRGEGVGVEVMCCARQ